MPGDSVQQTQHKVHCSKVHTGCYVGAQHGNPRYLHEMHQNNQEFLSKVVTTDETLVYG